MVLILSVTSNLDKSSLVIALGNPLNDVQGTDEPD